MPAAPSGGMQPERERQVWIRARLGGERRMDIAEGTATKIGVPSLKMLKRLQNEAKPKLVMAARMSRRETEMDNFCQESRVDPYSPPRALNSN